MSARRTRHLDWGRWVAYDSIMGLRFEQYVKRLLEKVVYSRGRGDDSYTVHVPLLPRRIPYGNTVEQARDRIKEAIEGWIFVALRFVGPLPSVGGQRLNALQGKPVKLRSWPMPELVPLRPWEVVRKLRHADEAGISRDEWAPLCVHPRRCLRVGPCSRRLRVADRSNLERAARCKITVYSVGNRRTA